LPECALRFAFTPSFSSSVRATSLFIAAGKSSISFCESFSRADLPPARKSIYPDFFSLLLPRFAFAVFPSAPSRPPPAFWHVCGRHPPEFGEPKPHPFLEPNSKRLAVSSGVFEVYSASFLLPLHGASYPTSPVLVLSSPFLWPM